MDSMVPQKWLPTPPVTNGKQTNGEAEKGPGRKGNGIGCEWRDRMGGGRREMSRRDGSGNPIAYAMGSGGRDDGSHDGPLWGGDPIGYARGSGWVTSWPARGGGAHRVCTGVGRGHIMARSRKGKQRGF